MTPLDAAKGAARSALYNLVHHPGTDTAFDIEVKSFDYGRVLAVKLYDKVANESWIFEVDFVKPRTRR